MDVMMIVMMYLNVTHNLGPGRYLALGISQLYSKSLLIFLVTLLLFTIFPSGRLARAIRPIALNWVCDYINLFIRGIAFVITIAGS